jgi:TRAP transporter TAXI family solute receptor
MSGKKQWVVVFYVLVLLITIGLLPQVSVAQTHLKLATATKGGTYYPVGVALATLINDKLSSAKGISMEAVTSAGSFENIDLLEANHAQLAIIESLVGAMAWRGIEKYQGRRKMGILSITALWEDVVHMLVKAEKANTGNVMDLAQFGKDGFSMGKRGSGTYISNETILTNLGIDPNQVFSLVDLGYDDSSLALQKGSISGMSTPAGLPVKAVTEAFSKIGATNLRILDFNKEQVDKVNYPLRVWGPYVIPANTYPGQTQSINSIAQSNFLAVRQNVDEETVYLLTKTIYENLSFLKNAHKAISAMDLKKAILNLPAPLHPGAIKYYEEQGIKIPPYLFRD